MTTLTDHQFEIVTSEDGMNGFVFGIGASVSVDEQGFDTGGHEWLTQDATNTRRGNRGMGRDVLLSKTWAWSSHVSQDDVATAVSVLESFSSAWSPEELVRSPGSLAAIRYRLAGRDRRVFGRPRRFSAPPSNLILNGYVPVTHDFELVDGYTYDDLFSSALISYSSTATGGFKLPSAMPLATFTSDGVGSGQINVGGNARAYPVIRMNGPWTNPVVDTDQWTLSWSGSIASGDWIEVDTRPWRLSVLRKSGASAVAGLDRRLVLEDCYFAPGTRPYIQLGGSALAGNASALVKWRNTWKSI